MTRAIHQTEMRSLHHPVDRVVCRKRSPSRYRRAGADRCRHPLLGREGSDLGHTLEMIGQAADEHAQLFVCRRSVCRPMRPAATAAFEAIRQAAAKAKVHVVANLRERADGKTFLTSYLIGPEGAVVGSYRKSHRLPDEPIALGDELPVFDTPYGELGLMIGTDLYWPEIPLVLALKGAELVLCSTGPSPCRSRLPGTCCCGPAFRQSRHVCAPTTRANCRICAATIRTIRDRRWVAVA